jgi:beta-galactosidase
MTIVLTDKKSKLRYITYLTQTMIKKLNIIIILSLLLTNCYSQLYLFDASWRFCKGGMKQAETPGYNDSSWRIVDLPHDWSIEDLPGTNSPFDHNAISQVSSGYTVGGTGWYRKSFTIPEAQKNKHFYIQFDGVYMNSDVWLNGEHIGNHPYGYTSFWYDITGYIKTGKTNLLAVEVKNEGQNSRWYSGSGIYRHVWLRVMEPVHLSQWGIRIITPEVSKASAKINIRTSVSNETKEVTRIKLVTTILNAEGHELIRKESTEDLKSGSDFEFNHDVIITNPHLWSTDTPSLHTAVSEVYSGNELLDRAETKFGIRSISFTSEKGFLLNDLPLKLKGGCVHHDNGPLGARTYDRAEERRVELLKASGFNAIRCAHNPPSPAFLDACDRLGMLVIDEAFDMWRSGNNPYDYHLYFDECWQKDIDNFIKRDINHPSVILWSIGNEIHDMEKPEVIAVEKMLAGRVRSIDQTRPVTAAVNNLGPEKDDFFSNLDVCGYNYAAGGDHGNKSLYFQDHLRVPERIMFGSESYPKEAFNSWMSVLDNPFVTGDFVWTAFDHIGEAGIGWCGYWQEDFFPWNLAYCGDIDICGWKRPQSYYRDAIWKENQISLFVAPPAPSFRLNPNKQDWSKWEWYDVISDWTWPGMENKLFKVSVYSSCQQVELYLNGKSLGRKQTSRTTQFTAEWDVPYNAGELKAVGYNGNLKTAIAVLQTAGEITSIKMSPDRSELTADGQDLSYITVELTDSNGNRNPKTSNLLKFRIEGEGTIAGVGNANPVSLESFQLPQRKAWLGRCLVIVKSTDRRGRINLIASGDGLAETTISLTTK